MNNIIIRTPPLSNRKDCSDRFFVLFLPAPAMSQSISDVLKKEVVFDDGTVWDNPNYENWFKTYAGKEIDIDELQSYYPDEYKIGSD